MDAFKDMFGQLIEVWQEMLGAIMGVLPKILSFVLWIIAGFIILPAVFIAGNLYPKWTEWGEDF
jgi:hypothetical protein